MKLCSYFSGSFVGWSVADIVPHVKRRSPWVPAAELRRIVREAPADAGLLDDLAEIRGALVEDE